MTLRTTTRTMSWTSWTMTTRPRSGSARVLLARRRRSTRRLLALTTWLILHLLRRTTTRAAMATRPTITRARQATAPSLVGTQQQQPRHPTAKSRRCERRRTGSSSASPTATRSSCPGTPCASSSRSTGTRRRSTRPSPCAGSQRPSTLRRPPPNERLCSSSRRSALPRGPLIHLPLRRLTCATRCLRVRLRALLRPPRRCSPVRPRCLNRRSRPRPAGPVPLRNTSHSSTEDGAGRRRPTTVARPRSAVESPKLRTWPLCLITLCRRHRRRRLRSQAMATALLPRPTPRILRLPCSAATQPTMRTRRRAIHHGQQRQHRSCRLLRQHKSIDQAANQRELIYVHQRSVSQRTSFARSSVCVLCPCPLVRHRREPLRPFVAVPCLGQASRRLLWHPRVHSSTSLLYCFPGLAASATHDPALRVRAPRTSTFSRPSLFN